jgi:hypothetical protein
MYVSPRVCFEEAGNSRKYWLFGNSSGALYIIWAKPNESIPFEIEI